MRRRRMLWPRLQSRFRPNKKTKTKLLHQSLTMPADDAIGNRPTTSLVAQAGAVLDATFRMTKRGAPEIRVQRPLSGKLSAKLELFQGNFDR